MSETDVTLETTEGKDAVTLAQEWRDYWKAQNEPRLVSFMDKMIADNEAKAKEISELKEKARSWEGAAHEYEEQVRFREAEIARLKSRPMSEERGR